MTDKISFFIATAYFNILRFLPNKRQQFTEYLESFAENVSPIPDCQEILEVWLDAFEFGGLLLGNVALFLIGFLLMTAADAILHHTSNAGTAAVVNFLSGLYCVNKFTVRSRRANILVLFYVCISMLFGFQWLITMLFAVLFVNSAVLAEKGGSLC